MLVLTALAALCYWPMLAGRVPFPADLVVQFPPWESQVAASERASAHADMGDLVTELYPWKAFTRRSVANGTFPLWNPAVFLGAPFQADPQTGLFYPVNMIYAVLPTPLAWSVSFLIRTVLAGLLTALLARRLEASDTAALVSGVVFAFAGWTTAFQARPHLDSVLWLPLVLVAVDRLESRPGSGTVALAGAAFAIPVLAGQPESAAHVTLIGLLFFGYRLAWPLADRRSARTRGRFVLLFAMAGILALGLAAVQILPSLEFIGQLDRGLAVPWPSKPLREVAAFVSRDLRASPNSAGIPIPEGAAYAGMLTLLLAPLSFLHRNRRDTIFFVLLIAMVVQIVYGFGPAYWLSAHTPILRGIPNGRLLGIADLSLAVLAGLGLSALGERRNWQPSIGPWLLALTVAVPCALGLGWLIRRFEAGPGDTELSPAAWARSPWGSAAALAAAVILLAAGLSGFLRARTFELLALVFCALDLMSASYKFIPFASRGAIYPPSPTMVFLRQERDPTRVTSVDRTYGPSFEMMYGLEAPGGFNVVAMRTKQLLATMGFREDAPALSSARIAERAGRLLDLMNVKYLVATTWNRSAELLAAQPERFRLVFSDTSVRIFENQTVLPRAFLVPASDLEVFRTERAQRDRLLAPGFDPGRSVIIRERDAATVREASSGQDHRVHGGSAVTRIAVGNNATSVDLVASQACVLILSQAHYPGWEAEVDGRSTPALRVDYAFTGAAVPGGTHTVRFVFRPKLLRIGGAITVTAFLVVSVLASIRRRVSAPQLG